MRRTDGPGLPSTNPRHATTTARAAALAFLVVAFSGCSSLPLVISTKGPPIIEARLGSSPRPVSRVRLLESVSGRVIWEVKSNAGMVTKIRAFDLALGENSVELVPYDTGTFRVLVPVGKKSFVLEKGVAYRVVVWGRSAWVSRSGEFSLTR